MIFNARLGPDWAQTERKTMSIGGRAISSLLQTQGIGDLYRIYTTAARDRVDFNLGFIPATFTTPHARGFRPNLHARPITTSATNKRRASGA